MFFKSKNSAFDYMIVGLGNPGLQYDETRHNAGFMAIDLLAKSLNVEITKHKFESLYADCKIGDKRILLIKPQTYMNNSGRAVLAASSFYKIPTSKILVIFDDISLDIGNIRIRRKGSAGGHNGVKDIIELLGTDEIMRIKVGVGQKPNPQYDLVKWVLGKIPNEQREVFNKSLETTADAAKTIVNSGIDKAMNAYSK